MADGATSDAMIFIDGGRLVDWGVGVGGTQESTHGVEIMSKHVILLTSLGFPPKFTNQVGFRMTNYGHGTMSFWVGGMLGGFRLRLGTKTSGVRLRCNRLGLVTNI